jgi:flagellar biogenesis protein FliO
MAESQLPASAETQLATEIGIQNVLVLIVYLVLILVAAYFITKYVSKRALRRGMRKPPAKSGKTKYARNELGRLISVADRIVVDKEKTIMVLEFNDKYYLISTTAQEMKCIDKVPVPPRAQDTNEENEAEDTNASPFHVRDGQMEYRGFGEYIKDLWKQFRLKLHGAFHKNGSKGDFESQLKNSMKQPDGEDAGADREE